MRFKTNMVIGVLFAALAAFVYLHEIKGEEERLADAKRSSKLLEFSDHEVQRISVQRPGTDAGTIIERRQDEWWITEPVEAPADEEAVERYLRNISETEAERVMEDSVALAGSRAAELELRYGLAEPRLSLFIDLSEGLLDTIRFGVDSPTERYAYAQRRGQNKQVFTVRAWRFDNLDKGLFDLRDKRLIAFDTKTVREISISHDEIGISEGVVQLTRTGEGDGWQIKSPVQADADKSEVDKLLNKLLNSTAESFVIEAPNEADLTEAGLAPRPLLEVALTVGDDRAVKTLRIGNQSENDGHSFARDLSRPAIFLVDSTVVNTLGTSLFTLRDKTLLSIDDPETIQRLELHRAPEGLVFAAERDSTGGWLIVAPQQRPAISWKVNGILTDMEDVQIQEFVVDAPVGEVPDLALFGLDTPLLRLRLSGADDDTAAVELLLGNQSDDGVFATLAGSNGVSKVSRGVLEGLEVELDDVTQAPVDSEEPAADAAGSQ